MPAPQIGLILGAGGARGLSHVGVLRGLLKAGIKPHIIVGASSGAIVGAMYAARQDIDWIESKFRELPTSEPFLKSGINWIKADTDGAEPGFFQWASKLVRDRWMLYLRETSLGAVKVERLRGIIEFLLPESRFEDLTLPFACRATDLLTGEAYTFQQGDLIEALLATSAIPGYIEPVRKNESLLVDGGIYQPVPTGLARSMGAEFTIAVDVSLKRFNPLEEQNILSIVGRAAEISSTRLASAGLEEADIMLEPDTMNLHWTQFDQLDQLAANGEAAVDEHIAEIKAKLGTHRGVRRLLGKLRRSVRRSGA